MDLMTHYLNQIIKVADTVVTVKVKGEVRTVEVHPDQMGETQGAN